MPRVSRPTNPRAGLPTPAAAEYAGVSVGWLENDRKLVLRGQRGYGPPFRRVGSEYRYDLAAIDAWRDATTVDPANPPQRKRGSEAA